MSGECVEGEGAGVGRVGRVGCRGGGRRVERSGEGDRKEWGKGDRDTNIDRCVKTYYVFRGLTIFLDGCEQLFPDLSFVHSQVISNRQQKLELNEAKVRVPRQPFFIQAFQRHP